MPVGFRSPRRQEHGGGSPWSRTLFRAPLLGLAVALVALASPAIAAGAQSPASASASTSTASAPNVLRAGQKLLSGSWLVSSNGLWRLVMQPDGNLVLYLQGKPYWSTNTRRHAGDYAVMQSDGNFVIYQGQRSIWSSASSRSLKGAYYLSVQNDGNVVIYTPTNKHIWATNTPLGTGLQYGDSGPPVLALQKELSALGYWLGTSNGFFGDSTQQAVWALQKAAGLSRTGAVDPQTAAALSRGVVPKPRRASGYLVEVDLHDDLLMVVNNGKLLHILNTSTGGGYTYTDMGVTSVAITPTGVFHIYAVIDGLDVDSLGALWRPRFFTGGFAIHGDSYVPPYPVSHGCVRVSNEAINWIWASNILPIGTEVWVY